MTTPLRIVIPGGSGKVGNIISSYFHAQGHDVVVLAQTVASAPWRVVHWMVPSGYIGECAKSYIASLSVAHAASGHSLFAVMFRSIVGLK